MLQINFYPESDKQELSAAAKEYRNIWYTNGTKIVFTIEQHTHLQFKVNVINAIIFNGISYSYPLRLNARLSTVDKQAELIHELLHRVLMDNKIKPMGSIKSKRAEEIHKVIYLVLYDIWSEVLGVKVANNNQLREESYGDLSHKKAWKYALSFSAAERKKKFREVISESLG